MHQSIYGSYCSVRLSWPMLPCCQRVGEGQIMNSGRKRWKCMARRVARSDERVQGREDSIAAVGTRAHNLKQVMSVGCSTMEDARQKTHLTTTAANGILGDCAGTSAPRPPPPSTVSRSCCCPYSARPSLSTTISKKPLAPYHVSCQHATNDRAIAQGGSEL